MKVIRINTPKGQFDVPLKLVAENRADYYIVEKDGLTKESKEYQDEIDWVIKDEDEGVDWILNNSDWVDWENVATKVNDDVNTTDEDFWSDSDDFNVVTVD